MQQPPQSAQYQPMEQWAPPEPVSAEQDIQDLAMEIYARLAIDHIKANAIQDIGTLRRLARDSLAAAEAFFEE